MPENPKDAQTEAAARQPRKLHVDESTIAELNVADAAADRGEGRNTQTWKQR